MADSHAALPHFQEEKGYIGIRANKPVMCDDKLLERGQFMSLVSCNDKNYSERGLGRDDHMNVV